MSYSQVFVSSQKSVSERKRSSYFSYRLPLIMASTAVYLLGSGLFRCTNDFPFFGDEKSATIDFFALTGDSKISSS